MTSLDHELSRERTFHDTCRAALARMIEGADEQVVTGEDVSASGADAESLGYHLRSYAKQLGEEPESPLFFGRLDLADGRSHHIGRRRIIEHPAEPPLVIDWRAPVSRAFYQASARDPQGVAVRRRFGWAPWSKGASEDLTGLEDEPLVSAAPGPAAVSRILAGEIERPRVGPMRDIAATIQPEQDTLVRAELTRSVCVQGAPGTGKTAVGLHRAAYLLYTHPQRLVRSGLLILGPNRTFLSYIAEVLPALGEGGIRQSTVDDELARHPVRALDAPAAAAVKHSAPMAAVLHRALYGRVSAPTASLAVPNGSYTWRIPLAELARIVEEVRAEAPPYAVGRERVRTRAVRLLRLQAERRAGQPDNEWLRRMGRARPVSAFVDSVWPKVLPEEIVAEVLTAAVDPGLTEDERQAIRWAKPPRSFRSVKWSAADLVLIDEVAGLVERPESYGHVVIDEAQDLSPMQCRAIARRVDFGSVTVLGDLAQGTTPWAARNWPELLAHLGKGAAAVVPLTKGFRVPAAIVELANRLLGALDVDVPPGHSLRTDGELAIREVRDLTVATVEAVRAALTREGSVGVIADEAQVPALREALAAAGVTGGGPLAAGSAPRVSVLPAALAKGLEYDHVVAVEPAAIVGAEPRGLHRLYVVLTRAVSRLDVLHCRPLPAEMLDDSNSGTPSNRSKCPPL
ncbi:AAA family ATPase [Streptomyces sp. H27-C3]|uniref:HelD family protein n=1 Tax=Streptomyces sp. H27-C3 TaxID=3046305 RepID=UPI0024BAA4F8|nr:AAA family ATPase [Streptomyces sp. H27-C3]MDJ0466329.1 AAA family ATPase [Streptomyces sp. H27-C3]